MYAFLLGTEGIFNRAAAVLSAAGLWLLLPSELAEFSSGALTDFLPGRIAPEVSESGEIRMTRKDVATWMEKARTARQPRDRGIAIANLQNCAWVLLSIPGAKPAALELLNLWVMPNVTSLRSQPRTSSYENVVTGAYASYRQAGDAHGQRRVLELLSTQARDPRLRDLALLRLAGLKAAEGNLTDAIEIARKADARGEFAQPRAK
ncbi:MAG: hypothetical protein WBX20_03560, partial [Terrimicrobiaceae bacterium]